MSLSNVDDRQAALDEFDDGDDEPEAETAEFAALREFVKQNTEQIGRLAEQIERLSEGHSTLDVDADVDDGTPADSGDTITIRGYQ